MSNKLTYLVGEETNVENLLKDLLNKSDDFEILVVVGLDKDGSIHVGHSEGDYLQKVGMMQVGVDHLIMGIRYE